MTQSPNILLILIDQLRYDTLSCLGHPIVRTPHIDQLANEGALFTQATCSSPLCGPSRATLLTGLFTHGHHCIGNHEIDSSDMPELETWDKALNRAGYNSDYFGKWHTGQNNRECYTSNVGHYLDEYHNFLAAKGFDRPPQAHERIDRYTRLPYTYEPVDDMMLESMQEGYKLYHHNEAGTRHNKEDETLTAWTASQCINFLTASPQEPFNVTCSILHPHAPLIVSPPYDRLYDPAAMPLPTNIDDGEVYDRPKAIPEKLTLTPEGLGRFISLYFALISEVDTWVGKILDSLERAGLKDNTLVVLTSDHGEMMGNHGLLAKTNFFEESVRVPLIFRWPAGIKAGQMIDMPVSGADLPPTLLNFCGVEPATPMHGQSLKPFMTGTPPPDDHFSYSELFHVLGTGRCLRTQNWKYAYRQEMHDMLYDLTNDPDEMHNLAHPKNLDAQNEERIKTFRSTLTEYLRSIGHQDPIEFS